MTGHPGQIVVTGPAEAHRAREGRGGGLGQVAQEAEPASSAVSSSSKSLDQVAASVTSARSRAVSSRQRIGAVPAMHLDVQQGQARPAGRDTNRRGIHAGGQATDDDPGASPGSTLTVPLRCTRAPFCCCLKQLGGPAACATRKR